MLATSCKWLDIKGVDILSRVKWLAIVAVIVCVVAIFLLRNPKLSPKLSSDKFAEVYVELSIAKEIFSADSAKLKEEKERIFKEANVTPQEMDDFANKMSQNPGEWAQVWKKIVERLEQKREELK